MVIISNILSYSLLYLAFACLNASAVFDNSRSDNLAVYWGQDSAGSQQPLSFYCQDETIDVIPLAFLYIFFGDGGQPVIDFGNICNQWDDSTFPGTNLADCSSMAEDIKTCQSNGKIVTLSLGGGTGQVGLKSDSQANYFAQTIWDMFLGGSGDIRPFGDGVVLDGVDLDIESGSPAHYATFVNKIRSLARGAPKKYYVTAAPQCPFPDANIGEALNNAEFDAVYVQFYNNYCELSQPSEFNFDTWDNWARTQSPNPDVKVYIGAPGSPDSAGDGYVDAETLNEIAQKMQQTYSSFGGVMLWDADSSTANDRFDLAIKTAIRKEGSQGAQSTAKSTAKSTTSSAKATTSGRATTSTKAATSSTASKASTASAVRTTWRDPKAIARVHFPAPQLGVLP